MKYEFKFVKRSFTNKQGEIVEYVAPVVTIDGKDFELFAKQSDKALFKYLVGKIEK